MTRSESAADIRVRLPSSGAALRAVAGPGVPEALEFVNDDHERPVLVLSRVPGISIQEWAAAGEIPLATFLQLAVQLTDVLARLHDARLVHRDVCASNVLVDPERGCAHLVDFDLARPLGAATLGGEGEGLVGDLPYISPEQTGRMDRGVDSRSDLYSLGAVLYCALTGRPPFEPGDALSLIHAHMAKIPASAVSVRPAIPATLSRIVAKLLQKAPEDRYQTPRALHRDLLECQQQLERTGQIDDDLALGSADAPYRPLFSRRLYGREAELRTLLDAYARISTGSVEVLWIAGAPGIGKSALVNELRSPLARSGGHLAEAKFDLYRRDVPYGGFLQALDSLTQQLLTESDAHLARWRSTLGSSLGGIARALVDLVPDLAAVIGATPAVPSLGPLSAARLADAASPLRRAHYRRALRQSARRMRRWARHGPMNFEPAALLLEAERARLGRDFKRAFLLFKSSAESAKLHQLPHHEALAHEGRARLLLILRREVEAGFERERAAQLYTTWGATVPASRVQRLEA